MANDTARSSAPEAVTWADQMLRAIPGAGMYLPVKRDILGDPIKQRDFGIAIGRDDTDADGQPTDDVKRTLRDLGITLQDIRRSDPAGFRLTAKQLDQLREIRGREATDGQGRTMREALAELFDGDEFREMPTKEGKKDMVAEVIRDFNKPAREMLEERDPDYAASRIGAKSFVDYIHQGMTTEQATDASAADAEAAGLPEPAM